LKPRYHECETWMLTTRNDFGEFAEAENTVASLSFQSARSNSNGIAQRLAYEFAVSSLPKYPIDVAQCGP
jgi:hypothetical protein